MLRVNSSHINNPVVHINKNRERSPNSQIGPVHPCVQRQFPARHFPPFSHGMRQKS